MSITPHSLAPMAPELVSGQAYLTVNSPQGLPGDHVFAPRDSEARKASAEAKAWTVKPHSVSNVGSDSRTDSSSSTTATSEWIGIVNSSCCQILSIASSSLLLS